MSNRLDQLRTAVAALAALADERQLAAVLPLLLPTGGHAAVSKPASRPVASKPKAAAPLPLPEHLVQQIETAAAQTRGGLAELARQMGLSRSQLSPAVRAGAAVSANSRARIQQWLARQPAEAVSIASQTRDRVALLKFGASELAESAGISLPDARRVIDGHETESPQLAQWVDRDLMPDGHGGFVLL